MSINFYDFIIALSAAAGISYLSYKLKLLTKGGAASAFILGTTIFTFGQLKWSVPLISFFIFSNAVSKLGKKYKSNFSSVFEKTSQRDFVQVLANGLIGGVLVLINFFYENEIFYIIYLGSLSAVCADTWATEIGTLKETVTYNVLNLRKTAQGISGGVSVAGTIGSIAGAVLIACSAVFWIHLNLIYYFCLIIISGLAGSFVDSILGVAVQLKNKCSVCGKITENKFHCGEKTFFYKGRKWMTNDTVNLFAGITGGLTAYFINVIS